MRTPTIADLQVTWSSRDSSTKELSKTAIRLLTDGEPVTPEMLSAVTGVSMEDVAEYIDAAREAGAEMEDGAIVGNALSLRPTPHRFRVRGNGLYTWCGFDALFVPIIVGERAEVASTCPVTGETIQLTVDAEGTVEAATPAGVVVGIVGEDITSCCVAGPNSRICTQMPFFASREAGERWQAEHPGVAIVDLDDAREVARSYVSGCC